MVDDGFAVAKPAPCVVVMRLALLNLVATLAILAANFGEVHWFGAATVAFLGGVWVEYAVIYLLPVFLTALLLAWNARDSRWRGGASLVWMALGGAAVQLLLVVDHFIFRQFVYHLNGFVWNLMITPGGLQSMDAGGATTWFAIAIAAGVIAVEVAACFASRARLRLWEWLTPRRPRRALAWSLGAFALLAGGERLAFSLASLADYQPIVAAHGTFPFYMPTRMRKFAIALGFPDRREHRVDLGGDLDLEAGHLNYPRAPITLAPDRRPLDILWLVSESWRADTLDDEVMPATSAFARGAWNFREHVSGGNGTRMGVFSMFYGIYGSYWFPFLSHRRGPVLVDQLLADAYQMRVSTSAKFSFPEFDKTIWTRLPHEGLIEGDESKRGYENDAEQVGQMLAWLDQRDRTRPFFAFHFFESPHAQYWFPDDCVIRTPYSPAVNYALLDREDMPLVKARYLNAVHHLDRQLGRLFDGLRERGLLETTIVVVTGDHGEEFMEKGRYGHHSTFSEEQIRTPLIVKLPGEAPRVVDAVTSHLDLVPTVLTRLGVTNPIADYSLGVDLAAPFERSFVVVADWDHLCVRDEQQKGIFPVAQRGFLGFEVTSRDDAPDGDKSAYRASRIDALLAVVKGQAAFRQ